MSARAALKPWARRAASLGPLPVLLARTPLRPAPRWRLPQPGHRLADDEHLQIKAFAGATSVAPGGRLAVHVHVDRPQAFRADVHRIGWYGGRGGTRVARIDGRATPQPAPEVDERTGAVTCDWAPAFELAIGRDWPSGIYLAVLTNEERFQTSVVFVVRDDGAATPAPFLYVQPVTTYQAYNQFPHDGRTGKTLYEGTSAGPPTMAGTPRAVQVSFDRPYAVHGAGDLLLWEVPLVLWLERQGYDIAYCTTIDVHEDGVRLLRHRATLSVGHDEYWTAEVFDAFERARDAGRHLAFFGANNAFWQVRLEAGGRTMTCCKEAHLDPDAGARTTVQFREVGRPEQTLIGVQYSALDRTSHAHVVANADHWAYAGTGLADGDAVPGIVGYESDRHHPDVPPPRSDDWTLLSHSPIRLPDGTEDHANASIYRAPSGAWVFATGTLQWSWALDAFDRHGVVDARLQRMTRNVLDRMRDG